MHTGQYGTAALRVMVVRCAVCLFNLPVLLDHINQCMSGKMKEKQGDNGWVTGVLWLRTIDLLRGIVNAS